MTSEIGEIEIRKVLCCPEGCARQDIGDCFVDGSRHAATVDRRAERQTKALLSRFRLSRPDGPDLNRLAAASPEVERALYEAALSRIGKLMDAGAGTPEGAELEFLSRWVEGYENVHFPMPAADGGAGA